jgi:hypothetical protein
MPKKSVIILINHHHELLNLKQRYLSRITDIIWKQAATEV